MRTIPARCATAGILLGLAISATAQAGSTVHLTASRSIEKRAVVEGVTSVNTLDAAEQALVADPQIEIILIEPDLLGDLDADRLQTLYENGMVIAVPNGKVSEIARALAIDIDLTDYHPVLDLKRAHSIAFLMALFDDAGQINGHHAFTDRVDGLAQGLSRAARMKGMLEAFDQRPAQKALCTWGNLDVKNHTGPAGTIVTGWTQVTCDGGDQYGLAITSTSNHDEVKVETNTYNNCGYWHQISSTTRSGTNYAAIPSPGVLAGDPSQCGSKFQANSRHYARKGSSWSNRVSSSCAGAC